MAEILSLLLKNEQLTLILAITLAVLIVLLALMLVIAVVQGRELSLGPLKISGKTTAKIIGKNHPKEKTVKKKRILIASPWSSREVGNAGNIRTHSTFAQRYYHSYQEGSKTIS